MNLNPLTAIDFYKADHRRQYPEGTEYVASNFTPRSAKHAPVLADYDQKVVVYGIEMFVKRILMEGWQTAFFDQPKEKVLKRYQRRMNNALGPGAITIEHIGALHDLGYLPIAVRALPEGCRVNMRVPMLTVINTAPEFFWLTNYLETQFSAEIWKPTTTATIAFEYRRLLTRYAHMTGAPVDFVPLQGHDFSARGMSGMVDAAISGTGHLTSFVGTDTVAAIDAAETYYGADSDVEVVGVSVPATEHSVMCMGTKSEEVETFRRLIEDLYPTGIVSIVSDTWDFWQVMTGFTRALKDTILNRQPDANGLAKVVFRPDSGDPVKIICGDPDAPIGSARNKGAMGCLWEVFGGTVTVTGHRLLHERVGLIYGDSITLARCEAILKKLGAMGFASTNVVFGIGSHTYQYLTRDTFGFAMKATWGQVNGEGREIFKDPVTDDGIKKSARGLLRVEDTGRDFILHDQQNADQLGSCAMEPVFENGKLRRETRFSLIRERLAREAHRLAECHGNAPLPVKEPPEESLA